jgi:hypothetical protein
MALKQNNDIFTLKFASNFPRKKFYDFQQTNLCYKAFYGCNLRMGQISWSVCPCSIAPLYGILLALPAKITRQERLARDKHTSLFDKESIS